METWKILKYIWLRIKIVSGTVTDCAICQMFVYKHSETIEYVKKWLTFQEKYKLYGQITSEFLVFRMRNFQDIIFLWAQTYRESFKSALVYLKENEK